MPDPLKEPGPSPIPFTPPTIGQNPQPQVAPAQTSPVPNQAPPQVSNAQEPKKSNKMLLIILIVVLILLALGAAAYFLYPKFIKKDSGSPADISTLQPKNESTSSAQDSQKIASEQAQLSSKNSNFESSDFSIMGPADWTKIPNSAGSIILFQNTTADTNANGQTFPASINVATDFLQNDMTLDEYAKKTAEQRTNTVIGYKLLSQTKGTMGKQAANIDVYLAKIGNIDVKQGQIYTIKNHKAYLINFSALANSWDKYAQIFNITAQSFQFTCNSGACLPN